MYHHKDPNLYFIKSSIQFYLSYNIYVVFYPDTCVLIIYRQYYKRSGLGAAD